jgi:glycosyltransferase involved in cell wall biosynthesis
VKILEITNVDFSLRQFLLPLMRGIRARGHDVVGVSADGELLAIPRAEGFRIIPVPFVRSLSPTGNFRAFRALRRVMRAERPDLIHAHSPIAGFLARLAAWSLGLHPIAYTCHGYIFSQRTSLARRGLGFALEWLGGRMTDIYLTVSTEDAADARRLGIAGHAIAIGNGRDPAAFKPDPAARARLRAEFCVPTDRVVVVIVSRLVRDKGYVELLRAMGDVDAELWVVGERLASDRGEDLEPYVTAAPNVRRLGYREDVAAILAAADIFVLPSYFEALPMSVIEAMLVGLPVVATNVRGPREQVMHRQTGLLVPLFDIPALASALQALAADPIRRAQFGQAGRARALIHYTEARVVARTLDLLGL